MPGMYNSKSWKILIKLMQWWSDDGPVTVFYFSQPITLGPDFLFP